MSPIETLAASLSVVYVFLAVRNKPSCFIFGFLGSLIWAYSSYKLYNLKWDALLNIFYAGMSMYGFWLWTGGGTKALLPIQKLPLKKHLPTLFLAGMGTLTMAYIGQEYINSNYALGDGLTTILSIIGTVFIAKRYLSSWIYLLIADLFYIYIYYLSGAGIFMWMMVFYSIMAILGFIQWHKIYKSEKLASNSNT
jgi:nicotinamide mononucleotide transporter